MSSSLTEPAHITLQPARRLGRCFQNPVPTTVGGLSLMWKVLPRYLTNKEERVPRTPLGPFHTDPNVYAGPPASGLRVTWMGHSTLLIELDGWTVLTDPVWDERCSPVRWAGPKRFFPAPLPLASLPRLDAVIVSHDHYDHLGESTIRTLAELPAAAQARWVTSLGVGKILVGYGVARSSIQELNWTEGTELTGSGRESLRITALPARHFSGRGLRNRFQTLWSSFVLRGARRSVYFGADSGYWDGFAAIGQEYGPFDLTMLDTGASDPMWAQIHMGPEGAARSWAAMGGRGLLMPIHWALFDLALHAWRQPIARMTELAAEQGIPLWSPTPGVPTEVEPGVPLQTGWWRPKT